MAQSALLLPMMISTILDLKRSMVLSDSIEGSTTCDSSNKVDDIGMA